MTNKKTLSILLLELAKMTNNANSPKSALEKGLKSYLALENYPMYGGYNLIFIDCQTGAHGTAFNSFSSCGGRVPAKVMIEKIRSFMAGISYSQTN